MALHVAVLVPLRQQSEFPRLAHLDRLVRRLCAFLPPRLPYSQAAVDYTVVVAEEADTATRRFNRGALLNLAFHLCPRPVDMVIFHDVDLLPSDDLASYAVPLPRRGAPLGARWGRYAFNPRYQGRGGHAPCRCQTHRRIPHLLGMGGKDTPCACAWRRPRSEVPARGDLDLEAVDLATKLQLLRDAGAKCPDKWEQLRGTPPPAPACATRGAPPVCARASAAPPWCAP